MKYKACVLRHKGMYMKQFEYLTHSPDFIREVRKDGRERLVEYDESQELGRQGWEQVTARQGGKWIFKREAEPARGAGQGRLVKSTPADFDRGWQEGFSSISGFYP
jgi:hypothetical protein